MSYTVDEQTGCWLWEGKLSHNGYGRGDCSHCGQLTFAHRIFYADKHGPIPKGLVLDHLCGVPRCVNPDHLEPVTNAVNQRRSFKRPPKLSDEKVRYIKRRYRPYSREHGARAIAKELEVSHQLVSMVVRGERWSDIT